MGFSVSGSAAIIFAALFIAFGMWYTASANTFEQMNDAHADRTDAVKATSSSGVEITGATYDATADELTVTVENTGAAQLGLDSTDLLVDGQYQEGWQDAATVEGNADTRLWLGSEQVTITLALSNQPDRVKVVAETGVSDTAGVSAL
jgi:flagellar protein FlaF